MNRISEKWRVIQAVAVIVVVAFGGGCQTVEQPAPVVDESPETAAWFSSPEREMYLKTIRHHELAVQYTFVPGSPKHVETQKKLDLLREHLCELDKRAEAGR